MRSQPGLSGRPGADLAATISPDFASLNPGYVTGTV
jgi:hypothetical protein